MGRAVIVKGKTPEKLLMSAELDLVDIRRIRNPTVTRFTWRQKKPIIQRRLDYWLVSRDDSSQDDIDSVDIKTSNQTIQQ